MDFCLDWAELRVPNRLCGDGHGAGEQGPGPNQGSSSVNHFQVKGVVGTMQCFGSGYFSPDPDRRKFKSYLAHSTLSFFILFWSGSSKTYSNKII